MFIPWYISACVLGLFAIVLMDNFREWNKVQNLNAELERSRSDADLWKGSFDLACKEHFERGERIEALEARIAELTEDETSAQHWARVN